MFDPSVNGSSVVFLSQQLHYADGFDVDVLGVDHVTVKQLDNEHI